MNTNDCEVEAWLKQVRKLGSGFMAINVKVDVLMT